MSKMKNYRVIYEIEAESEDDAYQMALENPGCYEVQEVVEETVENLSLRLARIKTVAIEMQNPEHSKVSLAGLGKMLVNYCLGYERDGKTKLKEK